MWDKRITVVFIVMLLGLNWAGCVSSRKNIESEDLKARITELERILMEKEEEIGALQGEVELLRSETRQKEIPTEKKNVSKMTSKQIQKALKNAGFYDGLIDGKIGKKTTQAIKDFQKSKGLTADGVVGKKTRAELSAYLD